MSDEECIMLETWNSREALHAHIGNCFPAYSKMMAYCEMNEMFCICDSAEDVEFYKKELAVWGPKRVSQCLVFIFRYSDIQPRPLTAAILTFVLHTLRCFVR